MPQFERKPLAAAILIMFSTPLALAQTQPEPQPEQTLPTIRVQGAQQGFARESTGSATRTETPLRDIPQFINSIPEEVIRSRGVSDLREALRTVPGISYAAAEGGTQANQVVYLRGFPLNGDNYIDGLRDLGEYNRDLFATETVEVLKGPSALLFGRGGSGGIVNQISKSAGLLPHKEVSLQIGSYQQRRLTGDLNAKIGENSAFRVVALAEDSGYYRYPQGVEKQGLAPSLRLGIGTATEVSLSYYYLKTRDVTDYGQPTLPAAYTGTGKAAMPNVPADYHYGLASHDYTDHETHIATARIDHTINRTVSVHNTLRFARYRRDVEATIATISGGANPGLGVGTPSIGQLMVQRNHDSGRTRESDDDTIFNQTDLVWKFAAGGTQHTLITGMEIARERIDRLQYLIDSNPAQNGNQGANTTTPFLAPNPYTAVPAYTKVPGNRSLGAGDTLAFHAQDQLTLNDYWKALVGVRWERYEADVRTISSATGRPTATGGPFNRKDEMVSGRLGLIWQPTARQSYYVAVANSYNPSGELGVYGGTSTSLNANTLNLDPEENRNYEAGAHWDIGDGLQLRSAVFRTEKINQRIQNSITNILELAGKRRVEGVEFELAGHITPNWEILSGVAFQHGRIVSASVNQGNVPLGVADTSGSVWSVYRPGGGWEVGAGMIASSGFYLTDANNGEVPSYAVFDATLAWVQKDCDVRLNVYNLADKIYYLGGYNNSPNRVLPGVPRSASVTFRYKF